MPTDPGISHCISRLTTCPDLASLRRVWEGLGVAYQKHPLVLEAKERMKESLNG